MKKNKVFNIKNIVIFVLIVLLLGFLMRDKLFAIYNYYNNNGQTMKDPGGGPTADDLKYRQFCSLLDLYFDARSSDYKLQDYKCSADEQFKGKIADGQEAVVEIYTKDFEQGKKLFRDWLKSKGLVESPTLRITYTFKPQ